MKYILALILLTGCAFWTAVEPIVEEIIEEETGIEIDLPPTKKMNSIDQKDIR